MNRISQFVENDLAEILIQEAEGRGRSAESARKALLELYMYQANNMRSKDLADAQDLSEISSVSYKALEAEQKLRGGPTNNDLDINLPDLEE